MVVVVSVYAQLAALYRQSSCPEEGREEKHFVYNNAVSLKICTFG